MHTHPRNTLARAAAAWLALVAIAQAYDLSFEYTSFESTFGQSQFNVLNHKTINGQYMMTSTDNHRPEMVANGNALAQFYNNFNADYNHPDAERRTGAEEADFIHQYTLNNSTDNGPRPDWLILNEISASQWQLNPGVPSLSTHRTWVIDCVTRLHDVYGYNVITYSPYFTVGTANGPSWQALAAKSYVAIEAYLSGTEVMSGGSDYASRVAWAQSQYQNAKNTYLTAGVPADKIMVSEHFASNNATFVTGQGETLTTGWGRAGLASASDWDQVIMIRQDAIRNARDKFGNIGFVGFLAYNWGGNGMGITQAEQIQHEYYYRSRLTLPTQKPQWLSDSAINVNGTVIPLSWSQPLNWKGGVPNAPGAEVNFWRTIATARAITLDGSKTLGKMLFESSPTYTINAGTGGSVVFDNAGSTATLNSSRLGSHTINPSVQLNSNLLATIDTGTLTMTGSIFGTGGLTKAGPGTLTITGNGAYDGNTVVQAGRLNVQGARFANTADIFLSTGSTLNLGFSGNADVIDSLFLDGASQPVGTWGAIGSTADFTTPFILGAGLLRVSKYAGPAFPADFTKNGIVDNADYLTWRLGYPTTYTDADFDAWRANYGRTAATPNGSGAATAAVPEPASMASILLAIALAIYCRPSRRMDAGVGGNSLLAAASRFSSPNTRNALHRWG